MIIDHLENVALYSGLGDRISKALAYLKETDFSNIPLGKYNIEGEDIFVIVTDYETKNRAESKLEGHKQYIDVQFMAKGSELIGYAHLQDQIMSVPYNNEGDYAFYEGDACFTEVTENMFTIFFPSDLHMPGIFKEKAAMVKKVVVKVKV